MSPRLGPLVKLCLVFLALLVAFFPSAAESPAAKPLPQAAPTPASPPAAPPAAPPGDVKEAVVFDSTKLHIVYQDDGSGVRELSAVVRVLSQAGVQGMAVLSFPYTSSTDTVEFDYVRVRKADGTVVVTPEYNIQDMPSDVTRTAPMYSDIHEKHVTVKALGVGDTLEYLVRYRTTKPQVPGQFWFEHTFPKDVVIKDEELVLDVPKDKYVKVSSPDYKFETKDDGARRIYTWKTANLEREDTGKQTVKKSAPKPSVQITTFHSWDELGRWAGELLRSQVVVTPQIQAKAAELTKGVTGDDDKIRAIYDFVSTKYHYVSLSFGIGRYQPHPAEDVLENEYGDCKDKHTLLAALLKAAGYDAWPALINATRKIDPDVPSPGQFDHVITVVPQANKLLWLDTTPGVAPFGMLVSDLRDKQALVLPTGKPAVLMTTPAEPPFPSKQAFVVDGKLNADGTFTGKMQMIARGDAEVIDRYVFEQYPSAQWKDLVQQISYRWGFAGEVSSVTASKADDTTQPFEFSYEYKREKIGDWDNHRFNAPFPPMGLEGAADQKKPDEPVDLGAPGTIDYSARIELPFGYAELPPKLDLSEDYADYHVSYAVKDKVLTVTREMAIKKSEVPLSEWDNYQKFAKAVNDDHNSWITISDSNQSESIAVAPSNPEANRLFEDGYNALQNRDQTRAEEDFDQLIKLDPGYPYAHSNLATVYLNRGNIEGGIRELRKEEELHPDESYSYKMLARALAFKHENTEAIYQLHKLLLLDPRDRDAALMLGQLLIQEKKYPEAVTVLEKALQQAPDSGALKYQLGFAYVRNGDKEKGLAELQQALAADKDTDHESVSLNNVAYTLIEMDTGLEVAQQYALKALEQQETASLKSGTGREGLFSTENLSATWDTVGWIYFKQGQYDKSLPYLRASWKLSQNSEVGDHLGQLYAKLGKKQEAAQTYKLAHAALGSGAAATANGMDVSRKIKEHYQALMGATADPGAFTTSRRANGSFTPMPSEELSRMRMVKVTTTAHPSAHGTISIVFSPGKVEEVTQVDGDDSLKAMIDKIKAAKFEVEFPDLSPVRLVRRGIMSCGSLGCDLTLIPPDDRSLLSSE